MLYRWIMDQASPILMLPLGIDAAILVAALLFIALAWCFAPQRLVGRWRRGDARPAREIPVKRWIQFVYSSAPLCGLLGTTVGIMLAFATNAHNDADWVAAALASALKTTTAGLVLAIVALCVLLGWTWRYDDDR